MVFKNIVVVSLLLSLVIPTHAEIIEPSTEVMIIAQNQGLTNSEKAELTGTRKQLATIIFAGLAGAILGLSTLSFHGRPQDHLSSIAIGFAVGIIGGAVYTTYKAATRPYDSMGVALQFQDESFKQFSMANNSSRWPGLAYEWTF